MGRVRQGLIIKKAIKKTSSPRARYKVVNTRYTYQKVTKVDNKQTVQKYSYKSRTIFPVALLKRYSYRA